MLTNQFPLFVFLMKLLIFFNEQGQIQCDVKVVAKDTCSLKEPDTIAYPQGTLRAVAPDCAGREGINIPKEDYATFRIDDKLFTRKIKYGLKFFMKLEPTTENIKIFQFAGLSLLQTKSGSLKLLFSMDNNYNGNTGTFLAPEEHDLTIQNVDEGNHCNLAVSDDQSETEGADWTQLIGMKLQVSERKKRETPSGDRDSRWMMIGLDCYGNSVQGYLNVYINGKRVYQRMSDSVIQVAATYANKGKLRIRHAQFSCMEYTYGDEPRSENYFGDFDLKSCKEKYEGQPAEKFKECKRQL